MARPSQGTVSGRVWDIADSLSHPDAPAQRAQVVAGAVAEKIHPDAASTQFGAWKRATYPASKEGSPGSAMTAAAKPVSSPPLPVDRHWASLLKNGFTYGADWTAGDIGDLRLDRAAPDQPGVYVFVENDHVVYIGTARRRLADRMRDYRLGHAGQATSSRIKAALLLSLSKGNMLRVLFATPGMSDWNGLPVELAAGLEAGLLTRFQPPWNRKRLARSVLLRCRRAGFHPATLPSTRNSPTSGRWSDARSASALRWTSMRSGWNSCVTAIRSSAKTGRRAW